MFSSLPNLHAKIGVDKFFIAKIGILKLALPNLELKNWYCHILQC